MAAVPEEDEGVGLRAPARYTRWTAGSVSLPLRQGGVPTCANPGRMLHEKVGYVRVLHDRLWIVSLRNPRTNDGVTDFSNALTVNSATVFAGVAACTPVLTPFVGK